MLDNAAQTPLRFFFGAPSWVPATPFEMVGASLDAEHLEEIYHDVQDRLRSDNLANYKIPDIHAAPEIQLHFLADAENAVGLFGSKAIGEPPFMYGIGVYFALAEAIRQFNTAYRPDFAASMTPEKVLLAFYPES